MRRTQRASSETKDSHPSLSSVPGLQLQGIDDAGQPLPHITHVRVWRHCYAIGLRQQHRAQGGFVSLLGWPRYAKPTARTLTHWTQQRTWTNGPLTSEVVRQLLQWRPAVARRTVQHINQLALEGLFAGASSLGPRTPRACRQNCAPHTPT